MNMMRNLYSAILAIEQGDEAGVAIWSQAFVLVFGNASLVFLSIR